LTVIRRCPAFNEHHQIGEAQHQRGDEDRGQRVHVAVADLLEHADDRSRQAGDDTGENDQRHTVADAALGHLLAEPHQEHGACGQRDHRGQDEPRAGVVDHRNALGRTAALQRGRNAPSLEHGQRNRTHARPLVDLATTRLALLLDGLQARHDLRQQLHDDGCRDVRHHIQCEQTEAMQGATGEHVEHVHDGALLGLHEFQHGIRIDARHRM
jgi:hypothetical protein